MTLGFDLLRPQNDLLPSWQTIGNSNFRRRAKPIITLQVVPRKQRNLSCPPTSRLPIKKNVYRCGHAGIRRETARRTTTGRGERRRARQRLQRPGAGTPPGPQAGRRPPGGVHGDNADSETPGRVATDPNSGRLGEKDRAMRREGMGRILPSLGNQPRRRALAEEVRKGARASRHPQARGAEEARRLRPNVHARSRPRL